MSDTGLVITTRSGSVYDIYNGKWWRNGAFGGTILTVFGMPDDMTVQEAHGWEQYDITSIQVGRRMYLAGFREFVMSTHVTQIVEKSFDQESIKEPVKEQATRLYTANDNVRASGWYSGNLVGETTACRATNWLSRHSCERSLPSFAH